MCPTPQPWAAYLYPSSPALWDQRPGQEWEEVSKEEQKKWCGRMETGLVRRFCKWSVGVPTGPSGRPGMSRVVR